MSIRMILSKKLILLALDAVIFFLALGLALLIRRPDLFNLQYLIDHIPSFIIPFLVYEATLFVLNLYEISIFNFKLKIFKYVFYTVLTYISSGVLMFYFFESDYSPKTVLLIQGLFIFVFLTILRFNSNLYFRNQKVEKAIILMSGSEDEILVRNSLIDNNFGLYIDKVIDVVNTQDSELNKNSLQDYIKKNDIKVIVANTRNEKISKLLPHVYRLNVIGVRLYDIYVMYEYLYKKIPSAVVNYHWFYENVDSEKKIYDFLKRVIDLILCVPVLVVLLILHPWVVRNIKKDDDGEIYSIQERLGLYGKKIYIKKYRTMSFTDKGAWLEQSVNKVTRFGAFLRKTRIDELPQVYAVLKGDLTFIGPRTDIVNLGEKLTIDIPFYNIRYSVKPGLSGWAQTNMNYQPRTVEDTIERLKYDLYYVKNRSIVLDLIVLLKTIKTVLSREGS